MNCYSRISSSVRDNTLLLVHGTQDEQVGVSNTWALTQALVNHGVLFKQMIYPDASHSLNKVREHFFRTMEKYFIQVLNNISIHYI